MRFRPEQHLRRQSDIRAVREHGQRFDCRAFTVWCRTREAAPTPGVAESETRPNPSPRPTPRVCVIASTAAVGRAVLRNRAKRRLREVFRHQQQQVPANCDLLLIARHATTTWPMPELERKFAEACRHLAPAAASGTEP